MSFDPGIQSADAACSRCGRNPSLHPAPFCAACLLTGALPSAELPRTVGARPPSLAPGAIVGHYEIIEPLGEGGFAEVYSAKPRRGGPADGQESRVALKVIKRGMDSREILARFRAEQRAVQSLSHPAIVRLLEAGSTAEGLPYFVMAQVDGLPVTEYCAVSELPLKARLNLFLTLCDAVQHAHQKGILHRDLKPSNILVEDTPQGPSPKVIDFGIAKALEPAGSGETLVTQLGQVLGTPAYMSPEQAAGNDSADTRGDIYSLGTVLYEMLTGCPPFDPDALRRLPPGEWSRRLRENLPTLPSLRLKAAGGLAGEVRQLGGNLDQIIRKAMAPEPDGRYASAAAFAEDVQNWLEDRPVSARPPSLGVLLTQFVRLHRWPVAVAASILGGIVATAGIGSALAIQARRAEGRALVEKDRAVAVEKQASEVRERSDRQNYRAAIELSAFYLQQGQPYLAAGKLRAAAAPLRGWEWGWLMAAIAPPEAAAESGLEQAGLLAATPDGRIAAAAQNNSLCVVDVAKNRIIARQTFGGGILRLALSGDGLRLAVIESRPEGAGVLHVSRLDGAEPWNVPLPATADAAWEPPGAGGALLLVCGDGPTPAPGRLARFDPATGRVLNERAINRFKVHARSLFVGLAGKLAAAENSYKDLEIFSLPGLEILSTDNDANGDGVDDLLLDERGDRLFVGRGANVYVRPASHGPGALAGRLATAPVLPGNAGPQSAAPASDQVRHFNWLPDGRWLAVGDTLALAEGAAAQPLPASGAQVIFPLAGGRVLALLEGGRLEIRPELLRPPDPGRLIPLGGTRSEGRGTAFTPDSRRAVFQPWRRDRLEYVVLDAPLAAPEAETPLTRLPEEIPAEWAALPAVHPDGAMIVRAGEGLAAVRQTRGGFEQTPIPHTAGAWSAAASADGHRLAVGVPTGVRLLAWPSGDLQREWLLPGGPFRVAVLPLGRSPAPAAIALGRDATLHFLPFAGPPVALPMPFRTHVQRPPPVAFLADPPRLAGALSGGGFAVYSLRPLPAAPRLLRRVDLVPAVSALAFSPDARRLAVATEDHRLTVWDWPQALPLLVFPLNSYCASAAFSPDGLWLANTDYSPSLVVRRALPPPAEK